MAIDLELNHEQQLLSDSARDFFTRTCPTTTVRDLEESESGYSAEMWSEMARLGWMGITFDEAYGGHGGSFLDLYPLYEEMGRFIVPSPFLDTVSLAGELVATTGTDSQRDEILPAIISGDCVVSACVLEPNGTYGPRGIQLEARADGDGFVLEGTKLLAAYANSADRLLVLARGGHGDGVTAMLVDARAGGIDITRLTNIAGAPLFEVTFRGTRVGPESVLGEPGSGWAAFSDVATRAGVLQTASIVGAARAVLAMTNQYAKDREQFGNPIGRYQAVQYLVSDVLIDLVRAELLAKQAAFRIDAGKDFLREASMAIAFGKDAAAHFHRQAHEVHAGVAFMLEHDLTLYSRRSKYWEYNLGDARYHHDRLAEAMGLQRA